MLAPQQAPQQTFHQANVILTQHKTKQDLAKYHHACCGSHVPSTFIQAVRNGNFLGFPGLDVNLIDRHLPPNLATAKGHLDQERKNLRPTLAATSLLTSKPTTSAD